MDGPQVRSVLSISAGIFPSRRSCFWSKSNCNGLKLESLDSLQIRSLSALLGDLKGTGSEFIWGFMGHPDGHPVRSLAQCLEAELEVLARCTRGQLWVQFFVYIMTLDLCLMD